MIVEGDVLGWAGPKQYTTDTVFHVATSYAIRVSVVRTFKGSVPASLEVFGMPDVDPSGSTSIGELSQLGGQPRRAIFFLARLGTGTLVPLADQGYFWPDGQQDVLKNSREYREGVSRQTVESTIAEYRNAQAEGRACSDPTLLVAAPPADDPSDGGAAWQDAGP